MASFFGLAASALSAPFAVAGNLGGSGMRAVLLELSVWSAVTPFLGGLWEILSLHARLLCLGRCQLFCVSAALLFQQKVFRSQGRQVEASAAWVQFWHGKNYMEFNLLNPREGLLSTRVKSGGFAGLLSHR